MRAGISLLLGAVAGWLVLAPLAIANGWAQAGAANAVWYEPLVTWLLWPGVTLLVVSSLTSFVLTLLDVVRQRRSERTAHGPPLAHRLALRGRADRRGGGHHRGLRCILQYQSS